MSTTTSAIKFSTFRSRSRMNNNNQQPIKLSDINGTVNNVALVVGGGGGSKKRFSEMHSDVLAYSYNYLPTIPVNPVINVQIKDIVLHNTTSIQNWNVNFNQATISKAPVFKSDGGHQNNAFASFTKSAVQHVYTTAATTACNFLSNGGMTWLLVARFLPTTITASSGEYIVQASAGSTEMFGLRRIGTNGTDLQLVVRTHNGTTLSEINLASGIPALNTWYVLACRYDSSTKVLELRHNGAATTSLNDVDATTSFGYNFAGLDISVGGTIATTATTATCTNIDIGSFILYDRALSNIELEDLEDYVNKDLYAQQNSH